jgi:galactose-1-phosphate uridylyltransferase
MARPPLWTTPQEFEDAAEAYFVVCEDPDHRKIPTVNGLCLALGCCRDSLWEYAKKPEFSDAIKRARTRLEMAWEERLAETGPTGAIFWLKNQGWSDSVEQKHSGSIDGVTRVELVTMVSSGDS